MSRLDDLDRVRLARVRAVLVGRGEIADVELARVGDFPGHDEWSVRFGDGSTAVLHTTDGENVESALDVGCWAEPAG